MNQKSNLAWSVCDLYLLCLCVVHVTISEYQGFTRFSTMSRVLPEIASIELWGTATLCKFRPEEAKYRKFILRHYTSICTSNFRRTTFYVQVFFNKINFFEGIITKICLLLKQTYLGRSRNVI